MGCNFITKGSGANTKYYIQQGADTGSKKLLGRPDKYVYTGCQQGFKTEIADLADCPQSSGLVVYVTNIPDYQMLTLCNLIIVVDSVDHEGDGLYTYEYVYNAVVGRITVYPSSGGLRVIDTG